MRRKIGELFLAILILATGICLLFWSNEVIKVVTILLGSIFILFGIKQIINYLRYEIKSTLSLTVGILSIVIGIVLLFKQSIISETMSFFIGIFIVVSNIGSLSNKLENKSDNYKISVGLSIAGIIIGILCIVGKILISNIIFQFMGVLLIIYSVINIINTLIDPIKK